MADISAAVAGKLPRDISGQVGALVKGDVEGHPFRGNQWTTGVSGGPDTPEWKEWFEGSQAVDRKGRPLKLYHATNAGDISEFKPFTHFGTAKAANERYESLREFSEEVVHRDPGSFAVTPVYLSVKNPLRIPDLASLNQRGEKLAGMTEEEISALPEEDRFPRAWENDEDLGMTLLEMGVFNVDEFEEYGRDPGKALAHLEEKGYDSVVYENAVEDPGHDSWIVFDPKGVKSAFNRRPTKSPDISKGDLPGHPFRGNQYVDGEGGGEPLYAKTRAEFVGPYPETGNWEDEAHVAHRARENAWDKSVEHAMSMGDLDYEEARGKGYYADGNMTIGRGMEVLPDTLYHVTTAASKVRAEGLKSRDELQDSSGNGLGGGASNTISFTDSPETAKHIERAMHEMRAVARGDITIEQMVERAGSGSDAKKPYAYEMWKSIGGGDDYRNSVMGGYKEENVLFNAPKGEGWVPVPESQFGPGRYARYRRPKTEEERRHDRIMVYKSMAFWREQAGGPMDPLFFGSDTDALAATKPEDIEILTVHPKAPGKSKGYRVSALGEWRTFTGDAVVIEPRAHKAAQADDLAKYSPDQPRDERGRFTSAGASAAAAPEPPPPPGDKAFGALIEGEAQEAISIERFNSWSPEAQRAALGLTGADLDKVKLRFFHGTTAKYLDSIRKQGLDPKNGHRSGNESYLYEGASGESVFITRKKDLAERFGSFVAHKFGGKPALLTVDVPLSAAPSLASDEQFYPWDLAFEHHGKIPPEWITSARVIPPAEFPSFWLQRAAEGEPQGRIYVVVVVKADEDEAEDAEKVTKGDFEGHPFRGNQYTDGEGEAPAGPDERQGELFATGHQSEMFPVPGKPEKPPEPEPPVDEEPEPEPEPKPEPEPEPEDDAPRSYEEEHGVVPRVVFHGTTEDYLDSILEEGLSVSRSQDQRNFGSDLYEGVRGESIYVTPSRSDAQWWASYIKGGDRGVVLEIRLPKAVAETLLANDRGGGKNALLPQDIPPTWIVGVTRQRDDINWEDVDIEGRKAAADDGYVTIYLAVRLPEPDKEPEPGVDAEKVAKGDSPGHPFRGNQYTDGEGGGAAEAEPENERQGDLFPKEEDGQREMLPKPGKPRIVLSSNTWDFSNQPDFLWPVLEDLKEEQDKYERNGGQRGIRVDHMEAGSTPPSPEKAREAIANNDMEPAEINSFVIEEGQDFPVPKEPPPIDLMTPKKCYSNAAKFVLRQPEQYDYAEGFVVLHHEGRWYPIMHGWAVDKKGGTVVDPTLGWIQGGRYIGVRLTAKQLAKHFRSYGFYGVMQESGSGDPTDLVLDRRGYTKPKKKATTGRGRRKGTSDAAA